MKRRKQKWWQLTLLALAIGVLPVASLAYCVHKSNEIDFEPYLPAATAALGALWGFTGGMLRKSLLSLLLGVNSGSALGYVFGKMAVKLAHVSHGELCVILLGALSISILCMLLKIKRSKVLLSSLKNAAAGAAAGGVMCGGAWLVTRVFSPDILGWTVMLLGPFWLGPFLFVWVVSLEKTELYG